MVSALDKDEILKRVSMQALIGELEDAFRTTPIGPQRSVCQIPGGDERALLLMPCFAPNGMGVVKLATIFPDNAARDLPTVQAVIVAFAASGTPVAILDGTVITKLRTGAVSALASKYLSRLDSSHLVIIGTGALAPYMAAGHAAVRAIRKVSVVGRNDGKARGAVLEIRKLIDPAIDVVVAKDREAAISTADIVSCATTSARPVLEGRLLKPGTLVDLVGAFTPDKREADDAVVRRARIFVDTLDGALSEAGDLLIPLERGVITRSQIEGELADLVRQYATGRRDLEEIIVFKSVGTALEDLAAVQCIMGSLAPSAAPTSA